MVAARGLHQFGMTIVDLDARNGLLRYFTTRRGPISPLSPKPRLLDGEFVVIWDD